MRVERSTLSLLLLMTFGASGCAASPAPAAENLAGKTSTAENPAQPTEASAGEDTWPRDDTESKSAPAPSVTPDGSASADNGKPPETRTMDVIRQAVLEHRKEARKCYQNARLEQKELKGDLTIHFVLDPEGNVKLAELNKPRSTLDSPRVAECVLSVIKSIKFPKSSRGMETSTNYPFNFTP